MAVDKPLLLILEQLVKGGKPENYAQSMKNMGFGEAQIAKTIDQANQLKIAKQTLVDMGAGAPLVNKTLESLGIKSPAIEGHINSEIDKLKKNAGVDKWENQKTILDNYKEPVPEAVANIKFGSPTELPPSPTALSDLEAFYLKKGDIESALTTSLDAPEPAPSPGNLGLVPKLLSGVLGAPTLIDGRPAASGRLSPDELRGLVDRLNQLNARRETSGGLFFGELPNETIKEYNTALDRLHEDLGGLIDPHDLEMLNAYQGSPGDLSAYFRRLENYPAQAHGHYASVARDAQKLRDAVLLNELPTSVTAYRGLNVGPNSNEFSRPLTQLPKEGDILGGRGFGSFSLSPGISANFSNAPFISVGGRRAYLMDVHLPAGTPALPVRTGSSYDEERELLGAPGQLFRVRSTPRHLGREQYHLSLEALPYDTPRGGNEDLHYTNPTGDELARRRGLYLAEDPAYGRRHGVYGYIYGPALGALSAPALMRALYGVGDDQTQGYAQGGLVQKLTDSLVGHSLPQQLATNKNLWALRKLLMPDEMLLLHGGNEPLYKLNASGLNNEMFLAEHPFIPRAFAGRRGYVTPFAVPRDEITIINDGQLGRAGTIEHHPLTQDMFDVHYEDPDSERFMYELMKEYGYTLTPGGVEDPPIDRFHDEFYTPTQGILNPLSRRLKGEP